MKYDITGEVDAVVNVIKAYVAFMIWRVTKKCARGRSKGELVGEVWAKIWETQETEDTKGVVIRVSVEEFVVCGRVVEAGCR